MVRSAASESGESTCGLGSQTDGDDVEGARGACVAGQEQRFAGKQAAHGFKGQVRVGRGSLTRSWLSSVKKSALTASRAALRDLLEQGVDPVLGRVGHSSPPRTHFVGVAAGPGRV